MMTPRNRIMAVIEQNQVDCMPCFGANSTVTYDQMDRVQAYWPEGHEKAEIMAKQAIAAHRVLGFDAVRIPFDQAVEAEALGCKVKSGGKEGIPGVEDPPPYKIESSPVFPDDFLNQGRIPELLKAVRIAKKSLGNDVPIIGGIVGPFSLAGSLLGVTSLFKAVLRTPDKILPFLKMGETAGTLLANALIESGVDIIATEDMLASPNVIRASIYKEYVLKYQQNLFQSIQVPKILHICGNVIEIGQWMGESGAQILSIETKTNIKELRKKCGANIILMGGVDNAHTLLMGSPETVRQECEESIEDRIQILAPGCAIAPGTPTENLLAMVAAAKNP